jgi:hypothetical protein
MIVAVHVGSIWVNEKSQPRNVTTNTNGIGGLYSFEHEVTEEDRSIFEMDIAKRLQYPTRLLQIWVTNMSTRIKLSAETQHQRLMKGQTTIKNWIQKHYKRTKTTEGEQRTLTNNDTAQNNVAEGEQRIMTNNDTAPENSSHKNKETQLTSLSPEPC